LFGLALPFLAFCSSQPPESGRPPNFLVILIDDIGPEDVNAYATGGDGREPLDTPHLDALAADGLRFNTCYATPMCVPSRVEMLTGRYGFRTGVYETQRNSKYKGKASPKIPVRVSYEDFGDLHRLQVSFAEVLKTRGYATAIAGKWHPFLRPNTTEKYAEVMDGCGFDEHCMWRITKPKKTKDIPKPKTKEERHQIWAEPIPGFIKGVTERYWGATLVRNGKEIPASAEHFSPDLYIDFMIDFIRRNKDKPFLGYLPLPLLHSTLFIPPDKLDPGSEVRWYEDTDESRTRGFRENMAYLDKLLGRLTGALEACGIREDTVIVFTADNGSHYRGYIPGEAGKGFPGELGVRVPLIVDGPAMITGTTDALVDFSDLLPTLAELAGVKDLEATMTRIARRKKAPGEGPWAVDGKSFAPVLLGRARKTRDWIFSYRYNWRVLRDERWLLEEGLDLKFYDCGWSRAFKKCKDVTGSRDPEVLAARRRFDHLLKELPSPGLP
jgi:arylsulfatase A